MRIVVWVTAILLALVLGSVLGNVLDDSLPQWAILVVCFAVGWGIGSIAAYVADEVDP